MDLLLHGNSVITDYHNFCNVSIPFLEEYIKRFRTECFLSGIDQSRVDNSTEEWLDTIEDKLEYEAWYLGHWHTDKRMGITVTEKASKLLIILIYGTTLHIVIFLHFSHNLLTISMINGRLYI